MSIVGLEEGWTMLQREAIDVLQSMLNRGLDKSVPFSPKSYSPIYTCVLAPLASRIPLRAFSRAQPRCSMCYEMCTQRAPYNWSEQLYIRHGEVRTSSQLHLRWRALIMFRAGGSDNQAVLGDSGDASAAGEA